MTDIPQPSMSLLQKGDFRDTDTDKPQIIENTKLVVVELVMIMKQ